MKVIEIRENGSKRVYTVNDQPSKTDQQYKEDCDTNTILQKFMRTGQVTHLAKSQGSFQDVSEIKDLAESLQLVKDAESNFLKYPSKLRKKFNNNIHEMINWLNDPENTEEAIELGLKVGREFTPAETKGVARGSKRKTGGQSKGADNGETQDGSSGEKPAKK